MNPDAVNQYYQSLRAGQKYYRDAVSRGEYPYPLVLDEIFPDAMGVGREELGEMTIPTDLIVGTKSAGRVAALAGNFMPLLPRQSEFGVKWISLCDAHLGTEGIRDPIRCYEYLGLFYVQEGNKRLSVLKSFGAPDIPAVVTRLLPAWSEDHEIQVYYEFLHFFRLSGLYGVRMTHRKGYDRLLALLGMEEDHVWTEEERRRFSSGFAQFRRVYTKVNAGRLSLTDGEALLVWLSVFPFNDLREKTIPELVRSVESVWADLKARDESTPIEVSTQPEEGERSLWSRLWTGVRPEKVHAAFIYGYDPEESAWTRAHEHGRRQLARLSPQVTTSVHMVRDRDNYAAMTEAVAQGANVIFATTPSMIDACRRIAAEHKEIRVLDCTLSQPFTGVRTYYSRMYEAKFITGAIAGAMAEEDTVGYIASYPILGTFSAINAFALGARLTNPRARVRLRWTCVPGDPLAELLKEGVSVISNRDATTPRHPHWSLEWGTYRREGDGTMLPLAVPCWNWGVFYEKVVESILNGSWGDAPTGKAINYWWGLESGVLDVQYSPELPEGVRMLADVLRSAVIEGTVDPFRRLIRDQAGTLRCGGSHSMTPEELIHMDWLYESVEGSIPTFDELRSESRELVQQLGVYRRELPPVREAPQL